MKSLGLSALVVALILGCVGTAHAGPLGPGDGDPFTFNFDENGNGSISVNGGAFQPLNGTLLPDPSNGGVPALTYLLPGSVTPVGAGDVRVFEDAAMTTLGDAFRFTNSAGNLTGSADRLIFYSLAGGGMLADTGFPANLGTGATGGPVVENANGTFQFVAGGPNIYNGTSTEAPPPPPAPTVPEPSSLALLALGGVALAGWRRWRRRTA